DLAGRKLAPALFNLMLDGALTDPTVIIGVSRGDRTGTQFAEHLQPRVAEFSRQKPEPAAWDRFAPMLDFVGGEVHDDQTYVALEAHLDAAKDKGTKGNRVFYLSVPPTVTPLILEKLEKHGLIEHAVQKHGTPSCRVIVEKPFGRDLASARALNELT